MDHAVVEDPDGHGAMPSRILLTLTLRADATKSEMN